MYYYVEDLVTSPGNATVGLSNENILGYGMDVNKWANCLY